MHVDTMNCLNTFINYFYFNHSPLNERVVFLRFGEEKYKFKTLIEVAHYSKLNPSIFMIKNKREIFLAIFPKPQHEIWNFAFEYIVNTNTIQSHLIALMFATKIRLLHYK